MIVRPQQHWLRRIFVWHGSVLSKISSRLLLNFLFSIAVIFMLPWYTHLGIKFTLAPFSILGVAIAIFLGLASRYARPLSLSLPLQRRNITSDAVFNFFDNLLPDSPIVRDRIVKRYHAKSRQPFDLLSEIGRDSVGAVTLIPEDTGGYVPDIRFTFIGEI